MKYRIGIAVLSVMIGAATAAAFPRNNSWHTAAWGNADSIRAEAGGIYGTGGQSDFGVRCSHCHTSDRLGSCTDPVSGIIDFDLSVAPAFGSSGGDFTYTPGRRYQLTIHLTGEHRGLSTGHNLNGMAATIEDASGTVVGRFITDSGADSASCTTNLPPGVDAVDGPGTTFVYGDCHAVLSISSDREEDTWTFDWVAPSGVTGDLTLFVGVVDGDSFGESSLCDDVVERAIPLLRE